VCTETECRDLGQQLEDRLLALEAPLDTLELARRLLVELSSLRRDNTRLREELRLTEAAARCDPVDSTEVREQQQQQHHQQQQQQQQQSTSVREQQLGLEQQQIASTEEPPTAAATDG
jgi:hypothetical protein